jgi:hypothetical protein
MNVAANKVFMILVASTYGRSCHGPWHGLSCEWWRSLLPAAMGACAGYPELLLLRNYSRSCLIVLAALTEFSGSNNERTSESKIQRGKAEGEGVTLAIINFLIHSARMPFHHP